MNIKRTVELKELTERIHEIGHQYGLHVEPPKSFEIITISEKDVVKIPIQNAGIFYRLLIEDLVDDMVPVIEEDYYRMVIIKYVDGEFGKKIRERNKFNIRDYALMPALIIYTKSLFFNLNSEVIEYEEFIKDFEQRGDSYIKTFGSEQERLDYILSIDSSYRIIVSPVEVLINPTNYILL